MQWRTGGIQDDTMPAFYRCLQAIVDAGFANRVMVGSDQMVWPCRVERRVEPRSTGADPPRVSHRPPVCRLGRPETWFDRGLIVNGRARSDELASYPVPDN